MGVRTDKASLNTAIEFVTSAILLAALGGRDLDMCLIPALLVLTGERPEPVTVAEEVDLEEVQNLCGSALSALMLARLELPYGTPRLTVQDAVDDLYRARAALAGEPGARRQGPGLDQFSLVTLKGWRITGGEVEGPPEVKGPAVRVERGADGTADVAGSEFWFPANREMASVAARRSMGDVEVDVQIRVRVPE